MEMRIWHRHYPPGIAPDAPLEVGLTLHGMVARSVAKYGSRIAFSCRGVDMSYSELDQLANNLAGYFQSIGLVAGDRVALMLPNSLEYPACALAVLRAGMAVVSVNPLYTARELAHQLQDSGAKAIVVGQSLLPLVRLVQLETPLKHIIYTAGSGSLYADRAPTTQDGEFLSSGEVLIQAALQIGLSEGFSPPQVNDTDLAFLQYTGGTTGVSKGAALSHSNVMSGVTQQATWLRAAFIPGDTSCVTPLPLYHIFALNIMLLCLLVGGTNRLVTNPRDMDELIAEMRRATFHVLPAVNTLLNAMAASGLLTKDDFIGTRLVIGAGASVMQSVAERWQQVTGIPLTEGYGLTECSPGVTFNLIGAGFTDSVGMPFPSTDVIVINEAGQPVQIGEPGELCVKGPQVFEGYWHRPEETKKVFTADGWFRTGDVATMNDRGMFKIVDRLKDMILVSAFNVYPNEIEAVVSMMPSVAECACVGVPDERSGEAPHLFVVKRDQDVDSAQIVAHCRANLTAYKVPRRITFVDALPKSPVGKILRRSLRDGLLAAQAETVETSAQVASGNFTPGGA